MRTSQRRLLAVYTFLPWVQQGLARTIPAADDAGASLAGRVTLPVALRVDGAGARCAWTSGCTGPATSPGSTRARSCAPTRAREPRASRTTTSPASTRRGRPAVAVHAGHRERDGRLRPWLGLVVVRRQDGVRSSHEPGPAAAGARDHRAGAGGRRAARPAQSWAWAHAQIAGLSAGQDPADILATARPAATSRLLCPRRLEPSTHYLACVVPTFALGVQAGLGKAIDATDEAHLAPAWTLDGLPDPLRLPVYHSWEFATGAAGSFEALVRRIEPRPLPPEATRPAGLDVSAAGGGLPALAPETPGAVAPLESALRVPGPDDPPAWPDEGRRPLQDGLERVLDERPAAS